MDVNKEMGTAAAFAQVVWVAAGLFLYSTTPGATLFSGSAALFILGGMFASALLFGMGFYGLRRLAPQTVSVPAGVSTQRATRTNASFVWLLPLAEAVMIFIAADWTFQRLETARVGLPIEYARDRDSFNAATAAFANANRLEEQAKPKREAGQSDPELETRVVEVLEGGLEQARSVSDSFLAYLDPELPERYRTQMVRGYELLVQGRRTGDLTMQTAGNDLVREFYEAFLPTHIDAIVNKLGERPQ